MTHIFHEGKNCWRVQKANHVSVVVDYGNYYRDLRESIIAAKKSIFLLGWDIDSRIELLRGKDVHKDEYPVVFFDLICWKAKANPDLQIYLNRWDYSIFFMREREQFWAHKWNSAKLPNIHICMDDVVPLSACHHQKIAVIDDEIAYWGGMDVALGRWDFRQHHVKNKNRADPAQLPHINEKEKFEPYHDIQAVLSGPAARSMAEWARYRWNLACSEVQPIEIAPPPKNNDVPLTWPISDPPDFEDVRVALSRTMPSMGGRGQIEEIIALLCDEIRQAENFIYIENQFLACQEIAQTLNQQLRKKPYLQILTISCFNPNGVAERLAMWGGRVRFKDTLISGGVEDRVCLAYPTCCEENGKAIIRIHSKFMIVDDRYMHIGSANINDRSMGLDTEFDVSLYGGDEKSRAKIAHVRNDLIREHTGYTIEKIQNIIENGKVKQLLAKCEGSRQHLEEINDERYRDEPMSKFVYKFADPRRPLIKSAWTRMPRINKQQTMVIAAVLFLICAMSALWVWTPLAEYTGKENLSQMLMDIRNSPLALLWIMGLYVLLGLFFFPVTGMSAAVILIFGGWQGFAYATIGAMASAITGYGVGRAIGRDNLLKLFPRAEVAMDKIRDSGVIGVTVIRMLPIAPFTLVNMIMGVIQIPILSYLLGTFFGLSPGKIMLAIFGDSFIDVFHHPDLQNILYAVLGMWLWIGVIVLCNKFAKQWQARHEQGA